MLNSLKDLQYLKHLNSIRPIVFLALIIFGIYLMTSKPKKIKTTMEIELYKRDSILKDSITKYNATDSIR